MFDETPSQLSTDKKGDDSLVDTTADVYGDLDQTQNHISYPSSKWTNIRNNMGQGSGSSSASTTKSSTTSTHQSTSTTRRSSSTTRKSSTSTRRSSTSTSSGSKPTSGTSQCSGVSAWDADTEYDPGQSVTYSKHPRLCFGHAQRIKLPICQTATSGLRKIGRTTTYPAITVCFCSQYSPHHTCVDARLRSRHLDRRGRVLSAFYAVPIYRLEFRGTWSLCLVGFLVSPLLTFDFGTGRRLSGRSTPVVTLYLSIL